MPESIAGQIPDLLGLRKAGANVKGMVLAAGKGTRLLPLTGEIPKPMAPVVGKPMIQHIFELLAGSGVG